MTIINFFENFATLKLADVADDKSKQLIDNKVDDEFVIDKLKSVRIDEKKDVKKMFIHSRNVIMKCGNYKGYSGFVYEYEKEKLNVLVDAYEYVLAERYGSVKLGERVMTEYGESIVVSELESMYKISSVTELISLPKGCFIRLVTYMEGAERKWCEYKKKDDGFELVLLNVNGSMDVCLKTISDALKTGKFEDLYGEILTRSISNAEEYYMVCTEPTKKGEVSFFGRYGKLCNEIPKQYLVKYKRVMKVCKSIVEINNKKVVFKSGVFRGREGELLGVESASLTIGIESLSKKITEHLVMTDGGYSARRIHPGDVFYCDLELNDGTYFEVNECYENKKGEMYFIGMKRGSNNIFVTVTSKDIKKFMSGFKLASSNTKTETSDLIEDEEKYVAEDDSLVNIEEEVNDDEEVSESKDIERGFYKEPEVSDKADTNEASDSNEYECDMKKTFKDVERSFYTQRILSKDEKEIMKMIEKCVMLIGDVSNIYTILDDANKTVVVLKEELGKGETTLEWKNTDTKYIVACLMMYDMIRNGIKLSLCDFKKNILKLYNGGYLTKNTITNTLFIRSKTDESSEILKKIEKSEDEILIVKKLYKGGKYVEIIEMMMESCNVLLKEWFGEVIFEKNSNGIELIAVSKPHSIKEYPKYFLTTLDVMNNVMVETAKRVLWCPKSQKMMNVWKKTLSEKIEKEDNDMKKSIYLYVKDNLENAPFVLRTLEGSKDTMDQLRYRELKRSFDIFKEKLGLYLERCKNEKLNELEAFKLEKERVYKRRLEISNMDDKVMETPDIKGCSVKVVQKKKLRVI